jgi:peptidoglycan hydrolase CwlO-like protein
MADQENKTDMSVLVSVYDLSLLVSNVATLADCVKSQQESINNLTEELQRLETKQREGQGCFRLIRKFFRAF